LLRDLFFSHRAQTVCSLQLPAVMNETSINRRAFLRSTAASLVALNANPALVLRAAPVSLRIGVIDPASSRALDAAPSARNHGITMGVDEAKRAAELFGGAVEQIPLKIGDLGRAQLSAVIGDDNVEACAGLARMAAQHRILFMNVGCADDSLRVRGCETFTFHVAPSGAMFRDALAQSGRRDHASATAWDGSLTRFGADSLNQRFRAAFGRPMTSEAWTAWFAVKVLWELSLRAKSSSAIALRNYLERDSTQFDGHKGSPLSFRRWDHQLRQPLYVVEPTANGEVRVVAELPVAGETEPFRAALDRLGTPQRSSAPCGRGL
jgi:hypothetical protein